MQLDRRLASDELRELANMVTQLHPDTQVAFESIWGGVEGPEFNAGFLAGLVQAQWLLTMQKRAKIPQYITLIAAKLHHQGGHSDLS